MSRALLTVVAAALSVVLATAQLRQNSPDQNTWAAMARVKPDCTNKYQSTVQALYDASGNTTCKDLVFNTLNTVKNVNGATCPATTSGSPVWQCMSGWNGQSTNQAYVSAWRDFVINCEILYIANRVNTGESEDGFQWRDNSCWQRFNDMQSFLNYLSNAPQQNTDGTVGGGGGGGGGAGAASINALALVGASLVAIMMLMLG